MTVYFVNRSFYEGPAGKQLQRVQADSVLSCFRDRWPPAPLDPNLGADFLQHILQRAGEEELAIPQTMEELADHMSECVYWPQVAYSDHGLQVLTDDDEIEMAYYVFDDPQRVGAPAYLTAFLLHQSWRLPAGSGSGGFVAKIDAPPLLPLGSGQGTTWVVLLIATQTAWLRDLDGPMRIEGARLPELCRYLTHVEPDPGLPGRYWPWELRLLRTQAHDEGGPAALRSALERTNALNVDRLGLGFPRRDGLEGPLPAARRELSDRLTWIEQQQQSQVYRADPARSLIQVDEHVACFCVNMIGPGHEVSQEEYFQWIFFDDVWASAHPDLANGILHYASRWDVLSEEE